MNNVFSYIIVVYFGHWAVAIRPASSLSQSGGICWPVEGVAKAATVGQGKELEKTSQLKKAECDILVNNTRLFGGCILNLIFQPPI